VKHRMINTTRSLALRAPTLTARYVCPPSARTAGADPTKEVPPTMPALSGEAAVRHLRQTGLYDSLSAALAAARYEVEARKGGGYEASNPKQNFRIVFIPEGMEAHGSGSAGQSWRLGMRLAAYGYGERKELLTCAGLKAEGERIEYRLRSRDGAGLSEWYVNRADGLEHGFTIPQAPGERRDEEKLSLWVSLSGDLEARLADEGRAILLEGKEAGVGLRYDNLHAYDATGRELPSRMMLSGGGLKLEVSNEGAIYPVTIDPKLWVKMSVGRLKLEVRDEEEAYSVPTLSRQETRLTAGAGEAGDLFGRSMKETALWAVDGADRDHFGSSVAISGDTVMVGADQADWYSGAVYVFTRSGETWTQRQKFTASDIESGDRFGGSVAIDGDMAVVGADGSAADGNPGAAYVFARSGETWAQQQKLTASGGAAGDYFGWSVAISGDTVVVGADRAVVDANSDRGAAYVFTRSGWTWTQRQKLTASDGKVGDRFGYSVAIDGDTAVVGAGYADVGLKLDQGAAYVFTRSGETWTQRQKLTASDSALGAYFGSSVAISGDTVVVGARGAYVDGEVNQGAAYVFTRSGETWTQQQKLTASDGTARDHFGSSVAISGDTVVVGASQADVGGNYHQGAAYVFARSGATWTQRQKLTTSRGAAQAFFGGSVAISGGTMVVGAHGADIGANESQGAAYVFAPVTVNPAGPVLPEGAVGRPYNQTFTASGGTAPYTFAISGGIPSGLALAQNGTLSGTPAFPGMFTFTVEATDSEGVSGWREYTLVIKPPVTVNPPHPVLPEGAVEQPYNLTFTASGGIGPYTFEAIAGSFPPGLTLAANGNLSGTPTYPDMFAFRVRATDALGDSGWRDYTLVIKAPVNVKPTDPVLPEGAVGLAYRQLFTASGGTGPYAFTCVAGSLPAGLTLAADGNLTGTPEAEGEFTFTIEAKDDNLVPGQREYTLVIKRSLIVEPTYPILPEGKVGVSYQQLFTASGGTPPFTFELIAGSLPEGLDLAANGSLSGTPVRPGTFDFTVRARDVEGGAGERAYALTISQFLPA
jgi:hypothetical protein